MRKSNSLGHTLGEQLHQNECFAILDFGGLDLHKLLVDRNLHGTYVEHDRHHQGPEKNVLTWMMNFPLAFPHWDVNVAVFFCFFLTASAGDLHKQCAEYSYQA